MRITLAMGRAGRHALVAVAKRAGTSQSTPSKAQPNLSWRKAHAHEIPWLPIQMMRRQMQLTSQEENAKERHYDKTIDYAGIKLVETAAYAMP
jgi:hypothetical protein